MRANERHTLARIYRNKYFIIRYLTNLVYGRAWNFKFYFKQSSLQRWSSVSVVLLLTCLHRRTGNLKITTSAVVK